MPTKNLLMAFVFIFIFSCSKHEDYPSIPAQSTDPIVNFEAFWIGINDNYTFFAYDDLNWDDVYNEYRPKVTSGTTDDELKNIFRELITKLIDGHCLIRINGINYGKLSYPYVQKYSEFDTDSIVKKYYLNRLNFYKEFIYQESNSNYVEFYMSTIKNSNIIYIKYYTYQSALEDADQNSQFNNYLSQIQENGFDGIILDLRNNGGGLATSFKNLISKFVKGNFTWGYSKFRLGRDRYEMTPFLEETASFSGTVEYSKPLIILTNRYSYSAAELTTLALKNLSNVTVIGDTTGGAEGPIYTADSPDGGLNKDFTGNFELPNGWIVQLAQKASFDNQKNIYEGKGIPPHLVVVPSYQDALANKDNVLAAAIQYILE